MRKMASVNENYFKFEVHKVVKILQAEVSQSKIHSKLVSVYGQNVFSRKEGFMWCKEFKDGLTALNDDPQKYRGKPKTLHTEKCVFVGSLISGDR